VKRVRLWPAVWATVMLVSAACGPYQQYDPVAAKTDPEATARIALATGVTRYDPHRATSSYDNTWLFPVYDRLVHMSPAGEAIPGLATDWRFGDDGAFLEFELRRDVRFHDGVPFDAAAVAANIHRARSVTGSSVRSELQSIEAVEIVDAHRVRVHLRHPDAALPLILSDRAGMMVSPAAFDDPGLDRRGVGAGPFRHLEFRLGNRAVYERFDDYWDPAAAGVKRLELLLIPDEATRLNAVRSGQADGATIGTLQIEQARISGLNVQTGVGLEVSHIQLNRARSHFGDRRVRQAINHAIRREAIVRALGLGYPQPSVQPFPEGYVAFEPALGRLYYDYDPDRARALLAEAGLSGGFSFEMIVPNIPAFLPLFEALHAQLAAVGIEARPRMLEGAQVSERFYGAAESDAALVTWGGRPDPSQTLDLLFTPGALPNPGGHSTPEVMRLAALARREIDPDRRGELLRAATREVTLEALAVVISLPSATFATRPNVDGMQVWASGNKPEFRSVSVRR
jgi:peptide/nickel transport system substrate-binding protein